MIQLLIKTDLLRELDERKLIKAYVRLVYIDMEDVEDNLKIKNNLVQLLDWDANGDNGLGIYCSKFEDLKRQDWNNLIELIKDHKEEIIKLSKEIESKKSLENRKQVQSYLEKVNKKKEERYLDRNYTVSGRGKKARPCTYKGRTYKSRTECVYKEGISKFRLQQYLKETGQL